MSATSTPSTLCFRSGLPPDADVRYGRRLITQLLIALVSVALLLAIYFFWLLIPLAGVLLYVVIQYAFTRRGRKAGARPRTFRLMQEAEARAADIRKNDAR